MSMELDTWVNSIKEILDDPNPTPSICSTLLKLNLFASEIKRLHT